MADAPRIQEVIINLLHNAIKFTPPGGMIRVNAVQNGQMLEFSVADTGVGIKPSDLDRIFERFYKSDKARSGSGTGLGYPLQGIRWKPIMVGFGWTALKGKEASLPFHFR